MLICKYLIGISTWSWAKETEVQCTAALKINLLSKHIFKILEIQFMGNHDDWMQHIHQVVMLHNNACVSDYGKADFSASHPQSYLWLLLFCFQDQRFKCWTTPHFTKSIYLICLQKDKVLLQGQKRCDHRKGCKHLGLSHFCRIKHSMNPTQAHLLCITVTITTPANSRKTLNVF